MMDEVSVPGSSDSKRLDITAIVISYNSEGRIKDSIEALEEALSSFDAEILVIDNASNDASVAHASSVLTMGRVIANSENLGYGKAVNMGIRQARGRSCLIMNDDANIDALSVQRLIDALFGVSEVGMVGPRIVDEEGSPMPSARLVFPGPAEEFQLLRDAVRGVNRNSIYPAAGDEPTDVAWLVAACVLGKTDVLRQVGGFNETFFLYSEDIDLSRRLLESGYRVQTVPLATCVHTGSVSTGVEFGDNASRARRTRARDIYYRIWCSRLWRSAIHLRRAIGLSNQPERLKHHVPRVFWDGGSLSQMRTIPPLEPIDAGGFSQ